MSGDDVAINYASAFIDALRSPAEIQTGGKDLAALDSLLDQVPSLARVLDHPGLALDKRLALLDDALNRIGAEPRSRRLFHLIVEKGRLRAIKAILAAFTRLRDQRLNVESAEVVTAVPLGKVEKAEWEKALAGLTGRKVRVTYRTDAGLIGGALTRIGSVVYDGSLSKQLTRIRGVLIGKDAR